MHFIVERKKFLDAFKTASQVAAQPNKQGVKAQLSGVKVVADIAGTLTFSGTDLELYAETILSDSVVVKLKGEAVFPKKRVEDFVSATTSNDVEIRIKGNAIEIVAGKSKCSIAMFESNDFPVMQTLDDALVSFEIPSDKFVMAIKRVTPGIDDAVVNANYTLAGVLFDASVDNELCLATTDGRAVAVQKIAAELKSVENMKAIVPERAVRTAIKMLSKEKPVTVRIGMKSIMFESGDSTLFSRLIEGRFPNLRKFFAKAEGVDFVVPASKMLEAFRIVETVADAVKGFKSSSLQINGDEAIVESSGSNAGFATFPIEGNSETGKFIKLNSLHISPILQTLEDNRTSILIIDGGSHLYGSTEDQFQFAIMGLS